MSIFRSKKIFAYPESGPAVHYIPSSSKKEYKQKPLIIIFGEKII